MCVCVCVGGGGGGGWGAPVFSENTFSVLLDLLIKLCIESLQRIEQELSVIILFRYSNFL